MAWVSSIASRGQLDAAEPEFAQNLAINADLANRQNEARALNAIGHVHNLRRSYLEAIEAYRRALRSAEIGDRAGRGERAQHRADAGQSWRPQPG